MHLIIGAIENSLYLRLSNFLLMKHTSNHPISSQYPDWHNQPLRLNNSEMVQPAIVLDNFFDRYSLPGLRSKLKQCLCDALANKDANATDTLLLFDDIEKLIEAAYMVHKKDITAN